MNDDANPIISKFFSRAEFHPNAVFLDGKRKLTYSTAAEEITKWTQKISQSARGLPVILQGLNTVEWVICCLAARAAGLLVVPLSTEVTTEQLREVSQLLGPCYLLDSDRETGTLTNLGEQGQTLPLRAGFGLLTSGSTGMPRLALRSESSLLAEGERYVKSLDFSEADRILVSLPLCHAFTFGLALGGAIASGCTLELIPRFIPRAVQRRLREGGQSILPLVPASARLLCQTFNDGGEVPQGLRHIVVGAGSVTPTLERLILERLGRLPARNYGSTETGATLGTTGQVVPNGVTGAALPGVEVAIAGDSSPGALFVRTTELFLGYLTPEGIDMSRVSPDGWYSTGDLASCDKQGWVTVIGRLGDSLRRGGRFIYPAEVQQALASHPDITYALILGSRDEHGEDVVEAHVEVFAGKQLDINELRKYLEKRIEAYKMPTSWYFYDIIPRTSGGKPDRSQLRREKSIDVKRGGNLLSTVTAHRLSTAIISAHKLGILAAVEAGIGGVKDIATHLALDRDGVEVLLNLLVAAGLLACDSEGKYQTVEPLRGSGVADLIEFEDYLQRTWLSVESVEALVRGGVQGRAFEDNCDQAFLYMYTKVMGAKAKLQALHAWRQVTLPEGLLIDIGCPAGAWTEIVRQRKPECRSLSCNLPLDGTFLKVEIPKEPLAGIFIHNAVRHLAKTGSSLSLEKLYDALHDNGVLMISDIFIDAPSPTPWLRQAFMLDWLTHGSLAWPNGEDLCSILYTIGFVSIRRISTDPIFELLIAQKSNKAKE